MKKILIMVCMLAFFLSVPGEAAGGEEKVIYLEEYPLKEALEGYEPLPLHHIYPAGVYDITVVAADRILVDINCHMDTQPVQVKATLKIDDIPIKEKGFEMEPQESREVQFELEEMIDENCQISIRLDFEKPEQLPSDKEDMDFDGHTTTKDFIFEDLQEIRVLDEPVKIDGNLSEWEGRPFFYLGEDEDFKNGDPDTLERTLEQAHVYLGWDEEYLYLAVEAKVEEHFNSRRGDSIWDGDSIQFGIAPKKPGISDFNLCLALAGGEQVRTYQFGGPVSDLFDYSEYHVHRDDNEKKTFYEIKMPFEKLEVEPGEGAIFAFNIVIFEDADGEGYDYWLEMTPGIAGGTDPDAFNEFILVQ